MKRSKPLGALLLAVSLAVSSPAYAAVLSSTAQAARMGSMANWSAAFSAVASASGAGSLSVPSLGPTLPRLLSVNAADPISVAGLSPVVAALEAQGITPRSMSANPAAMTQVLIEQAAAAQAGVERELAKALKARAQGGMSVDQTLEILAKLDSEYAPYLDEEALADARGIFKHDLDRVDPGAVRALGSALGRMASALTSGTRKQESIASSKDALDLRGELAKAKEAMPSSWKLQQSASAVGSQTAGRNRRADQLPPLAERQPEAHAERVYGAHFSADELLADMRSYGTGALAGAAFILFRDDSFSGRQSALESLGGPIQFAPPPIRLFLERTFSFLDAAGRSETARQFVSAVGRFGARNDFEAARGESRSEFHALPPSPLAEGEYWDLATGMNGKQFMMHGLNPQTQYKFIDASPFVVAYLKEFRRMMLIEGDRGAENVEIVLGDVRKLEKPEKPLAVLRAKNVAHYAPGSEKELEEMSDWIAPGGQLIIENDSGSLGQQETILKKHAAMAKRLIDEGWYFQFRFGRPGSWFSSGGLDTMIFTRPIVGAPKRPGQTWREYTDIIEHQLAEARRRNW